MSVTPNHPADSRHHPGSLENGFKLWFECSGVSSEVCVPYQIVPSERVRPPAQVVNYAASATAAEEVVAEIKKLGGDGVAVQADMSTMEGVKKLFDDTATASARGRTYAECSVPFEGCCRVFTAFEECCEVVIAFCQAEVGECVKMRRLQRREPA